LIKFQNILAAMARKTLRQHARIRTKARVLARAGRARTEKHKLAAMTAQIGLIP
jgi:hypothetical protein